MKNKYTIVATTKPLRGGEVEMSQDVADIIKAFNELKIPVELNLYIDNKEEMKFQRRVYKHENKQNNDNT
jgi:hypothetical protein